MIQIKKSWIETKDGKATCYCDIYLDGEKRSVWFRTEEKYGKYLCTERADAYVVGLLNFAMRGNHDIISEIPITEELLYNIRTILLPSLAKYGKNLHSVKIQAPTASEISGGGTE